MITYNEAIVLANILKTKSSAIKGMELFGSVVRNGQGRDADFIVLVDEDLAKRWWQEERELIRVRWPDFLYSKRWIIKKFAPFAYSTTVHERRLKRLVNSAKILGIDLNSLRESTGEIPDFELFLFPLEWRTEKEINLSLMNKITNLVNDKNTLGFLKRIAQEAISIPGE